MATQQHNTPDILKNVWENVSQNQERENASKFLRGVFQSPDITVDILRSALDFEPVRKNGDLIIAELLTGSGGAVPAEGRTRVSPQAKAKALASIISVVGAKSNKAGLKKKAIFEALPADVQTIVSGTKLGAYLSELNKDGKIKPKGKKANAVYLPVG